MKGQPTYPLAPKLSAIGIEGCTCPWEWRSLGRLYGISMGEDWLRLRDAPDCPHHKDDRQRPVNGVGA